MARRKTTEELGQELEQIYTDSEGQLPDFTKLDGKPHGRLRAFLFGFLAFLAVAGVVSWAGFFFFLKPSPFTGDKISLWFVAPEQLTAGGETEIAVLYANKENVPVASASLTIDPPEEFIVTGAEPPRGEDGTWLIGSIAPGGEGKIILRGWSRKEIGETLTFQAAMSYKPADFNSDFQKAASHTVAVGDSVLKLVATAPEDMTPGDKIELAYEYENASDLALTDLSFAIDPLDGFVMESADPAPKAETGRWPIAKLEPRAKGKIVVRGTFSSASRGPKALHGRIGFVAEDKLVTAAEADAKTEVLKSALATRLIVNGSDKPPAVSFGDMLHFSLVYKNDGDVAMKDVTISAELPTDPTNAQMIDWVTLKDDLQGVRKDSVLTWTKKQAEGLAELKPGDEGTIDFSVQLSKKPASAEASAGQPASNRYIINAQVRVKVAKAGKSAGREVVSDPLVIKLNSDAVFKSYGRYFDDTGVPLGSGPMPPKVGEKTVYRVHWAVQNSLHELSDLSITTILPQGVKWTGEKRQVDAGDLTADDTGRKINWRLNKMPTSVTSLLVSFDVEVTPTFEDVGTIMDLTGENRFEAFDKETETVILKTESPVGTDLLGDEQAAGKGVVRE